MRWVTAKYKYENSPLKDKIWIEKRFAWRPKRVDNDTSVVWLGYYFSLRRLIIGGTVEVHSTSSAKSLMDFWDKVQEQAKQRNSAGPNAYSGLSSLFNLNHHGISDLTMIPYDYDFEKDLDNILDS